MQTVRVRTPWRRPRPPLLCPLHLLYHAADGVELVREMITLMSRAESHRVWRRCSDLVQPNELEPWRARPVGEACRGGLHGALRFARRHCLASGFRPQKLPRVVSPRRANLQMSRAAEGSSGEESSARSLIGAHHPRRAA